MASAPGSEYLNAEPADNKKGATHAAPFIIYVPPLTQLRPDEPARTQPSRPHRSEP